jgi:hypothetical protein
MGIDGVRELLRKKCQVEIALVPLVPWERLSKVTRRGLAWWCVPIIPAT